MRATPIGLVMPDVDSVLAEAAASAAVSQDHPEGIKGVQAVALGVHLAVCGVDRLEIRRELSGGFGYDLERSVESIRPD